MSFHDPFSRRFEVFGSPPQAHVDAINLDARELLKVHLELGSEGDGRIVLLQAPRAGYGKTALMQSVATELEESHQFFRIQLTNGRTTDAAHVLEYVLQSLCKVVPGSSTLTQLDLLARKVLALGLEPLVASGEVPCQDRESALESLQKDPAQTFDFHHDEAVTAHWTKSNFEVLGPRLAAELSGVTGASLREASYWVELLFRFATTPPDNVERTRLLFETIFRNDLQNQSSSTAEERLHGLLSLVATVTSPVLVVDDTEGLSTSPQDALALASFLSTTVQSCPGTLVLLSVNNDIWKSSFEPNLPGGLADRLLAYQVVLNDLNADEVEAIIKARAGERAGEVLRQINWSEAGDSLYPRKVVELSAAAWDVLDHECEDEVLEESAAVTSSRPYLQATARIDEDIASPVDEVDPLADLPDFSDVELGSVSVQNPVTEGGRVPSVGATGSESKEDVPVLRPEPSVLRPYESPFAAVSDGSGTSLDPETSDCHPDEVPVVGSGECSPLPPSSPVSNQSLPEPPSEAVPSPFELVPDSQSSQAAVGHGQDPAEVCRRPEEPSSGRPSNEPSEDEAHPSPFEPVSALDPESVGIVPDSVESYASPFEQVKSERMTGWQQATNGELPDPYIDSPALSDYPLQSSKDFSASSETADVSRTSEAAPASMAGVDSGLGSPPENQVISDPNKDENGSAEASSTYAKDPVPEDLDPTGGEIEFSKIRPLSEVPSYQNGSSSEGLPQDTGDLSKAGPDIEQSPLRSSEVIPEKERIHSETLTGVPEPMNRAPQEQLAGEGQTESVGAASASPFVPASHVDETMSSDAVEEATPSAESSFPSHEATPARDDVRSENPSEQVWGSSSPPPNAPTPTGWWPGDPAAAPTESTARAPSPFVAVGPSPYEARQGGAGTPPATDAAASDREEVERMLRLLRERQDNP